jgi:pyruvate dehydrogenase E2 component (dihydrolipoamide acetyltransferase)
MDVIMPQLGETVREGSVSVWYKRPGDTVTADEPLFEVETEKVTTAIPAPASGVLSEILVEPGVSVRVGTRLAIIDVAHASGRVAAATVSGSGARAGAAAAEDAAGRGVAPAPRGRSAAGRLSPVVRRLLHEHGIEPERLAGSGRDGRITPEDVRAHVKRAASTTPAVASAPRTARHVEPTRLPPSASRDVESSPASPAGPDDIVVPLNRLRRITAAHAVRSKAISPHTLQAVEVDFHGVDAARRLVRARWQASEGYRLTYLPFIARAVCEAISKFPYVNASFGEDALIVHRRVHLGIAVDLNFDGLAVAVVRDAPRLGVRGLAAEIHRLAEAVRSGRALPDELAGSTYTISNSGSFGTYFSAPIINQPQVAILSADGVRKKPTVIEGPDSDTIAIRPIGVLAQCFDHRAFDGAYSAAYLRCLKDIIEATDWVLQIR